MPKQTTLQQVLSSLTSTGIGVAGAAFADEGQSRSNFAQNFIRVSEEQERRREQERQERETFVRNLAVSNPAAFAQLPPELQNAAAEPIAEQAGIPLDQASQALQQILTTQSPQQIQQAQRATEQHGVGLAKAGKELGSQTLFDKGLRMIDPTLGGQIPIDQIDPDMLLEAGRFMEKLTPESAEAFSNAAMTGRIDLDVVEFKKADPSTGLPDVTNMLAHQALQTAARGEEVPFAQATALQKKIAPDIPGLSANAIGSALASALADPIFLEAIAQGGKDGLTIENMQKVAVPALSAIPAAISAMGLSDVSPQTTTVLFMERIKWHGRLTNPMTKDRAIQEIASKIAQDNPEMPDEGVWELTIDKVNQIKGTN